MNITLIFGLYVVSVLEVKP